MRHTKLSVAVISAMAAIASRALAQPLLPPEPAPQPVWRPATRPIARPDGALWTARCLDLVKQSLQPATPTTNDSSGDFDLAMRGLNPCVMALTLNPAMRGDKPVAELRPLVDKARERAGEEHEPWDGLVALLQYSEDERNLRIELLGFNAFSESALKPLAQSDSLFSLTGSMRRVSTPFYDKYVPDLVAKLDAQAREKGHWSELTRAYANLASDAHRRDRPDRRDLYLEAMLKLLREHPEFEHPERGNTNAVPPRLVASLLIEAEHDEQIPKLMESLPNKTMKLQLAGGWVTALVTTGKLDVAKEVVERTVNELDADAGKRLASALEGTFLPPPEPPAATRDRPMRVQPPGIQEVIEAQNAIAAAKGDAIAAGDAGLAGNIGRRMSGSGEKLASHDWASLGRRAAKSGHPEEAKQAFERALDIFKTETSVDPAWTDEKIRFVREALPLEGGFELAANALNTSSPIDSSFRYSLAKLYAAAGDADRCRTLLEEAITSAPNDKGGSTMMAIAVMLDANGERERAERVFLDSIRYIHGEDFGIGGSRGLVVAAMRMNRLDLLEQVYNDTGPGMQLLLASAAAALSDPSVDLTREMEN